MAGRTLISRLPSSFLLLATRSAAAGRVPVVRLRPLFLLAGRFSGGASVRCFSSRPTTSSLNDPSPNWSNRPPKETILLDGCDFEHWLVVVEPPDPSLTRDEIIHSYIKKLAEVLGSEEEARMKIYSVSTKHYFAFGALVSEEISYKIKALENVRWVLPDSYLDVRNKDYGGEPFIDGQAVPYDPRYHEEWVRNNARANERSRRNDRPRNYDRSRNFERRRENMQTYQNRDVAPPPMPGSSSNNPPPAPPMPGGPQNAMPPPAQNRDFNAMPPPVQNRDFNAMPPPAQNRDFNAMPPPAQNRDFNAMPPPAQNRDFNAMPPPPNRGAPNNQGYAPPANRDQGSFYQGGSGQGGSPSFYQGGGSGQGYQPVGSGSGYQGGSNPGYQAPGNRGGGDPGYQSGPGYQGGGGGGAPPGYRPGGPEYQGGNPGYPQGPPAYQGGGGAQNYQGGGQNYQQGPPPPAYQGEGVGGGGGSQNYQAPPPAYQGRDVPARD